MMSGKLTTIPHNPTPPSYAFAPLLACGEGLRWGALIMGNSTDMIYLTSHDSSLAPFFPLLGIKPRLPGI